MKHCTFVEAYGFHQWLVFIASCAMFSILFLYHSTKLYCQGSCIIHCVDSDSHMCSGRPPGCEAGK